MADSTSALQELLKEVKMGKFYEPLIQCGVESIQVLQNEAFISNDELENRIGMGFVHVRRLRHRLQADPTPATPVPDPAPAAAAPAPAAATPAPAAAAPPAVTPASRPLQEQRRILFQHQALLRAQQLEVLRQQRVQEREERERQVEEDRKAAALKRDAERAAKVADRAMAAMAVRDARRAAKFVKEMAKSQRSTELQRQRVESKVYRESLADAKARSKLAKTQKSSDAAQQADAIASESTVSVILEHEARRKGAPARAAPPAPPPPFAPPFAAGGAPAPWGAYDGAGAFASASYAHAGYGGFEPPYAADYDFGGDFGPLGPPPPPEAPRYAYASASYAAERAPPDGGVSYERGAPRSPAPSYCPVAAPPAAAPPQQLTAADVARLLPPCCFCGGASNDPDSAEGAMIASVFLGPATKARPEGTLYRAHERCAELSPEVFLDDHGAYHNVVKAAKRGAQLRCFACDGRGATVGCHVASCVETKSSTRLQCERIRMF